MKFQRSSALFALASLVLALGCSDSNDPTTSAQDPDRAKSTSSQSPIPSVPTQDVAGPERYASLAFESNAAAELAVLRSLDALLQPMKDAEASTAVRPTSSQLQTLFSQGSPSLESVSTPYYRRLLTVWFDAFSRGAGKSWTPSSNPPQDGGLFGEWIFDARGLDLRQVIEKGLYSAALYTHATRIADGPLDGATTDRLLAIFGAHPTFPNNDKDPTHPDRYVAQYAERRDDETKALPRLYRSMQGHLTKAQAAIVSESASITERDGALDAFLKDWERTAFATVIYYCYDAEKKLSVEPPTDADLAAGLHSIGEIIGFLWGWKGSPTEHRIVSDSQVDALLTRMLVSPDAEITTYDFVVSTASKIGNLRSVIDQVKGIYGFSDEDIRLFQTNY